MVKKLKKQLACSGTGDSYIAMCVGEGPSKVYLQLLIWVTVQTLGLLEPILLCKDTFCWTGKHLHGWGSVHYSSL